MVRTRQAQGFFAAEAVDDGERTATLEKRTDWSESDLTGRPRGGFESCELTQNPGVLPLMADLGWKTMHS